MIRRLNDWPERLAGFIEARRTLPFAWGSNDCALFMADGIEVMTGVDLAAAYRGYSSAEEAARIVADAGGMLELAKSAGMIEKPRGFAQRGDGVLATLQGRETFGIVMDASTWCGPGIDGIEFPEFDAVIAVLRY